MNGKYNLLRILLFAIIPVYQAQAVEFNHHLIEMDFEYIVAINLTDFDSDGDSDIFVTTAGSTIGGVPFPECELYYLENDGSGNFERHSIITYDDGDWWIRHIDVVDFDGDSDLDLLITGGEGEEGWHSLTLLLNTGRDLIFKHHVISTGDYALMPWQIRAHDIDSDGVMDIIAAFWGVDPDGHQGYQWGGLFALLQTDSLVFQEIEMDDWGENGWTNLKILDINGDGTSEILADETGLLGRLDNYMWRWNGEGFDREEQPTSGFYTQWSDFNLDGTLDYVTALDSLPPSDSIQVRLFLQTEPFEFEQISLFTACRMYCNIAVGSIDSDGNPDILITGFPWDSQYCHAFLLLDCVNEPDYLRILSDAELSRFNEIYLMDINCDGRNDIFLKIQHLGDEPFQFEDYLEWYENTTHGVNDETPGSPAKFALYAAYPNPFNSSVNISFDIQAPSDVRLGIFNLAGRCISTLVDQSLESGEYHFNWQGTGSPAGIYFSRMEVEGISETRKMVLLR